MITQTLHNIEDILSENNYNIEGYLSPLEIVMSDEVKEWCKKCHLYKKSYSCFPPKEDFSKYKTAIVISTEVKIGDEKQAYINLEKILKRLKEGNLEFLILSPVACTKCEECKITKNEECEEDIMYTAVSYGVLFKDTLEKIGIELVFDNSNKESYIGYGFILL